MIWLLLIPLAAVVAWLWYPRRAPVSPFPPVTDTVAGHADRTRSERLTEGDDPVGRLLDLINGEPSGVYDWDGDDAA